MKIVLTSDKIEAKLLIYALGNVLTVFQMVSDALHKNSIPLHKISVYLSSGFLLILAIPSGEILYRLYQKLGIMGILRKIKAWITLFQLMVLFFWIYILNTEANIPIFGHCAVMSLSVFSESTRRMLYFNKDNAVRGFYFVWMVLILMTEEHYLRQNKNFVSLALIGAGATTIGCLAFETRGKKKLLEKDSFIDSAIALGILVIFIETTRNLDVLKSFKLHTSG